MRDSFRVSMDGKEGAGVNGIVVELAFSEWVGYLRELGL